MFCYIPPRPEVDPVIVNAAVGKFIETFRSDLPDRISDEDKAAALSDVYKHYLDGYETAKELESQYQWPIDTETVNALEELDYYVEQEHQQHVKEWIEQNDIRPLYQIGSKVEFLSGQWKTGIIENIYPHRPGCYAIREDGETENRCFIVKWEYVRTIGDD